LRTPKTYKVCGILLCVLSVPIILISLLVTLAVPVMGIIGIIAGVIFILIGKKYDTCDRSTNRNVDQW
jgi:hypothetical protein